MSERQLTLDGHELERLPSLRPLTDRQREVLRYVRAHGDVRPVEIGVLMHAGRGHFSCSDAHVTDLRPSCCEYASSDGFDALRRLERRGLVYRAARGRWRAVVATEDWRAA